ncbi:flagellar biosynthetic protein FliO [Enterobacter sp. Bisph1]|uniref:flagellar biosynthetic protein FliO n=1 Tax=Enterobacter sp. Bisph1 TaxID=1274399 RepID=UPI00057C0FF1|nr:flagellar biosynthetic protein FliO [Enterobacter sp. Bisph1]
MKTQATVSQPSAVTGSPLLQVSGALMGMIAVILIIAWLAKRFGLGGKTASARGLKVSASTTVGPRERVVIVDVEDARLVLGVTPTHINLLHKLPPAPAENEVVNENNVDFQSVMKNLLKRSGRS